MNEQDAVSTHISLCQLSHKRPAAPTAADPTAASMTTLRACVVGTRTIVAAETAVVVVTAAVCAVVAAAVRACVAVGGAVVAVVRAW